MKMMMMMMRTRRQVQRAQTHATIPLMNKNVKEGIIIRVCLWFLFDEFCWWRPSFLRGIFLKTLPLMIPCPYLRRVLAL